MMKISGFTVIRNAAIMGYPIQESIRSLLPLVDELVVGLGQSEDSTQSLIEQIADPKIKIFDTFWDPQKTRGGFLLSEKTNEALSKCQNDWCFYLQADEVLHEEDYDFIKKSLSQASRLPGVQGILFNYVHFYGSYGVIGTSRKWYRKEIRLIRKSSGAQSYKDAQGFRVGGERLQVLESAARIFHYGWVKPPKLMGTKTKLLNRLWHGNRRDQEFEQFQYEKAYGLKPFEQTHPQIMRQLVESQDWQFNPKRTLSDWKLSDLRLWSSDLIERLTGWRPGEYKPYTKMSSKEPMKLLI